MNNFVKHFKTNKTFRLSIVLFFAGLLIAALPYIFDLGLGTGKKVITLIGVVLSFAATEQMSKIIALIGAEDQEAREAKRRDK